MIVCKRGIPQDVLSIFATAENNPAMIVKHDEENDQGNRMKEPHVKR